MAARAGSTKGGSGAKVVDIATAGAAKGGDGTTPPPQPQARGPGSAPIPNQPSREEREALYLRHFNAIEKQEAVVEQAAAVTKAAQKVLNSLRKTAQGDGIKLGVFDRARELARLPKHEAVEEILLGRDYQAWMGLGFLGEQNLEATPTPAMDDLAAEAAGYLAGIRAEERKPPKDLSPNYHQSWLAGYDRGQERNAWAFNPEKAAAQRAQPAPEPAAEPASAPAEADDAPEPDGPQAGDVVEEEPGPPAGPEPTAESVFGGFAGADAFEASEQELAAQKGRPSTVQDAE